MLTSSWRDVAPHPMPRPFFFCVASLDQERSQANGAVALAFQHEVWVFPRVSVACQALIVITDKELAYILIALRVWCEDWPKPKKLKTQEVLALLR